MQRKQQVVQKVKIRPSMKQQAAKALPNTTQEVVGATAELRSPQGDQYGFDDAYDIQAARASIRNRGAASRKAVAWIEDNELKCAPVSGFKTQSGIRYVRCLEFNDGGTWRLWDETLISYQLLNDSTTPKERHKILLPASDVGFNSIYSELQFAITKEAAERDAIRNIRLPPEVRQSEGVSSFAECNPDTSDDCWWREHAESQSARFQRFGDEVCDQLDYLLVDIEKEFEGFTAKFEKLKELGGEEHFKAWIPSVAKTLMGFVIGVSSALGKLQGELICRGPGYHLDAATAMRQGFLMGQWLSEARAIIANRKLMKLGANPGSVTRPASPLYAWVRDHPSLGQLGAKEAFFSLDGEPDPEFPGTTMRITNDLLIRGDGRSMKLGSFQAKLSEIAPKRARKAPRKKN